MAAEYEVELQDDFSSPAGNVASSAKAMKSSIASVSPAMKAFAKDMAAMTAAARDLKLDAGGRIREANGRFANLGRTFAGNSAAAQAVAAAAEQAAGGLARASSAGSRLTGALRSAGSAGMSLLQIIGKMAVAAAVVVTALAVKFAKAGFDAVMFGARAEQAFSQLFGSARKGRAALEGVVDMATDLGLPVQDTVKQFQKLISMQFAPKMAKQVVLMAADMQALGASTDEVGRIITTITQIKGKGKLQAEELVQQLGEAGVSSELVIEALGKSLKKTTTEVRALLSAGKITADQGIAAIGEAIKKKAHIEEFGDAAKAAAKTLPGQWARIKSSFEAEMLGLGADFAPMLESFMPMVAKAASGIGDILSFALKIGKDVAPMFESFGEGFGGAFSTMFDAAKDAWLNFKSTLSAKDVKQMTEGFKLFGQVIGGLVGIFVFAATGAVMFISMIAEAAGTVSEWVASVPAALSAAGESITGFFSGIGESITGFAGTILEGAASIGTGIIDGIVSGIAGAGEAVLAALGGVVDNAIASVKSKLGIASPSKVFQDFGLQTGLGFAIGVDKSGADTGAALGGMTTPPPAPGTVGGGGGVSIGSVSIDTAGLMAAAQASPDPQAFAAAAMRKIEENFVDMLERATAQATGG